MCFEEIFCRMPTHFTELNLLTNKLADEIMKCYLSIPIALIEKEKYHYKKIKVLGLKFLEFKVKIT